MQKIGVTTIEGVRPRKTNGSVLNLRGVACHLLQPALQWVLNGGKGNKKGLWLDMVRADFSPLDHMQMPSKWCASWQQEATNPKYAFKQVTSIIPENRQPTVVPALPIASLTLSLHTGPFKTIRRTLVVDYHEYQKKANWYVRAASCRVHQPILNQVTLTLSMTHKSMIPASSRVHAHSGSSS